MNDDSQRELQCLLCGAAARRYQVHDDVLAFIWECAECGSWKAGRARELVLLRQSLEERRDSAGRVRRLSGTGRVVHV
jgi:ribosomal protein L37AE/L43A